MAQVGFRGARLWFWIVAWTATAAAIEPTQTPNECPSFPSMTAGYQKKFLLPMRSWAATHLDSLGTRTLLYPFSGSDAVTALSLFGRADHYILVSDNWVDLTVDPGLERQQIEHECAIESYFSQLGYLRTDDLEGKTGQRPRFIKLLAYSIAMSGAKIDRMRGLRLVENGTTTETLLSDNLHPEGIRFIVTFPDHRHVTIDYVRIDLSNSGLKRERVHAFLSTVSTDTVFLKSASHLLQDSYFSTMAGLITSKARHVVQDETGLDINALSSAFEVTGYGRFTKPQSLWKDSKSAKRLRAYVDTHGPLQPLPLTVGYEKPSGSILLVGNRRAPQ